MAKLEMEIQGKRARFFPAAGTDETVSMMLELLSEVWVLKERMYALEKVAGEAGIELTAGIEVWRPTEADCEVLDADRQRLIQSVLRTLEANHVPGLHLRRSLDAAAETGDISTELTGLMRGAA